MDYQEFQKEFGTEKQCLEYLYHLRWADGFCCPRCRHNEAWRIKEFKYKCRKCGYQTTVTAGTIFQDTHIPIFLWFKAAWLISTNDNKVSTTQLKKELGLGNDRTAEVILKKLRQAINPSKNVILQGNIKILHESNIISENILNIVVAIEFEKTKGEHVQAAMTNTPEELIDFIENRVATGSTIISDTLGLNGRKLLFEKGYIYKKRERTYKYDCAARAFNFLRFDLCDRLKGICSKEQLSIYLEESCAEFNRSKTIKITFQELLKNAVRLPPIHNKKILLV